MTASSPPPQWSPSHDHDFSLLLPPSSPTMATMAISTPSAARPPNPGALTRAEVRRARAARNRSSARRSRLRKKAETQRDLDNAFQVERRNAALKARVDALRNKIVGLQKIVHTLGLGELDGGGGYCGGMVGMGVE